MNLARIEIMNSQLALGWIANRYRVHQRLRMAYRDEPRLLFRIEEMGSGYRILAQASTQPDWDDAFADFKVLASTPQMKELRLDMLRAGGFYRFKLVANPVVTKNGKRLGLFKVEAQLDWLKRQFEKSGAVLVECVSSRVNLERSTKNPGKDMHIQTHLAVEFNGVLKVTNAELLAEKVKSGIGPAKAYGFGLLSLALFK